MLEASGIHWDAVTDTAAQRDISLQVLRQVPVLWIWDNVEPVTGFPASSKSDWSVEEQQELRAFLSAARDTKAKFLLTSRRDEEVWLGQLPRRVQVPPMPMQERLQLADAIAEHRGKRLVSLPDLTPLLLFTRGNPLTILVTVGEALRLGIDTNDRLDAFIAALRKGEAAFEDEETEGRSKSLGASLSYGFGNAFSEDERKILALLHLFQGFVQVGALCTMSAPDAEWRLDNLRGLTREQGIALLNRTAELGLLNAYGGGCYGIHPALPWYFRDLFVRYYPAEAGDRARRAFVEAMGQFGNYYLGQYQSGIRTVMSVLMAEEDNFLAAWRLAREHGWWGSVTSTMRGLSTLYEHTGRNAAWRRLVETVVPDFIDLATSRPLPGREDEWSQVTSYRVSLAKMDRDWSQAEQLQRVRLDWDRERSQPSLHTAPEARNNEQRDDIRTIGASVHELAEIQRQKGAASCADAYREAFDLANAIGDTAGQAICAYNLGAAYIEIADLRDLDEAERWCRKSLDLRPSADEIGRSQCLGQFGLIVYERFKETRAAKQPGKELHDLLAEAAQLYEQALEMCPETAITDRGITHNQLGNIYSEAGDIDRVLQHYRKAIRYKEQTGDLFGAGQTRYNVTLALHGAGRPDDARAYAKAALANFQTFGERATTEIQATKSLITKIDKAAAEKGVNA
jgi:tetratricopeptide (TPR) repeat protein